MYTMQGISEFFSAPTPTWLVIALFVGLFFDIRALKSMASAQGDIVCDVLEIMERMFPEHDDPELY